jgi:hypothetical protein
MKNLFTISTALFFFSITLFSQTSVQQPSGWADGSGGTIATLAELRWLSENPAAWDENWTLAANIDATETKTWNSGSGFQPIGNSTTQFTGNFNGSSHNISNLYINRKNEDHIGLFGFTEDATIESLGIINCNVSGSNSVGGLVGYNFSKSAVSNCFATGRAFGEEFIGGLVGCNRENSSVSNCYATVDVSGINELGGFIGYNNNSMVSYCYATGNTSGDKVVGGFIGEVYNSSISNCYATGGVTGNRYLGGFAGYSGSSSLLNCYSIGTVSDGESSYIGAFLGENATLSTITNGYYNTETSGQTSGIGSDKNNQAVTGLTTQQMKQQGSFSGFDFTTVWAIRANKTYPVLQAIDNAPFAITEIFTVGASFRLEQLLVNDCDNETLQDSLVTAIDSLSSGRRENDIFYLPNTIKENDRVSVYYRIGEKRTKDTLWGNRVVSVIIAGPNTAPIFNNTSLSTNEGEAIEIGLNSLVSDNEGDVINLSIFKTAQNGSLDLTNDTLKYSPEKNFNGSDSIHVIASDGLLSDTAWIYITVGVSGGTIISNPESENLSIYPNPVNSLLTIQCASGIEQLKVVSSSGAIVLSEKGSGAKKQLDLSHLQQGLYFLQVKTGGETIVQSICKE